MIDIKELRSMVNGAQFESFANSVIHSLLDRLEAAEKSVNEAYQRGYETGQEEIEKERDFAKEESERLLALAHDQNNELIRLREEGRTLRAKIEAMERQEAVAIIAGVDEYGPMLTWNKHWLDLAVWADLYALPGAQPAPSVPGKGDDIPCVRCGAIALDTGLECNECGFDNYEFVTGKPFSVALEEAKP